MKIIISSKVPEEILEKLKDFEINYHDSFKTLSKEELIDGVKDADILLCPLSDKIDREILESSDSLKLVANYGAGFDNIDIEASKELGIIVTNAPAPSSAVSTAELTFGLILASSRRIIEGYKDLEKGDFNGWKPTYFLGNELRGKTLGIIGMGNIGKNVAKRAEAFEMDIIYYSRTRKEEIENKNISYKELDYLLENSDIITIHTAYSNELHHMISEKEFKKMKNNAILVNAARGPLVKESALIDALKNHEIKAAALDVYEFEPKFSDELLKLENLTLAPHLGNATVEARMEMGNACVENILDFNNGDTPRNKVN